MRKSWFYKLLLSYLPVFFVISLSLLVTTYLAINELSKKSAIKSNKAITHNITKMMDYTLGEIDAIVLTEVQSNPEIISYFENTTAVNRQYANIQTATALKGMLAGNPLIDSIYLYNPWNQTVLTASTVTALQTFVDRVIIGNMMGSKESFRWIARQLPQEMAALGTTNSVISLVRYANLQSRGLIVVNIDTKRLQEMIESMSDKETTFVEVTDRADKLIVSNGPNYDDSESYIKPGKVLAQSLSEYTGWTVRSGGRNGAIADLVSVLFYLWAVLGIVLIAAGIFWILYVTKRNYKPLQTLMERISGAEAKHGTGKRLEAIDEFQFIDTTIKDLLDESSLLQEKDRENLIYRKKHLFHILMDEEASSRRIDWKQELTQVGVSEYASASLARVAIIEIDRYQDFIKHYNRDQHLLKDVLVSVTMEIFEEQPYNVWPEWIKKRQLAVLFLYDKLEHGDEGVEACCERLRAWVSDNLDFTITIGLGKSVEGIGRSYESFRSALHTVAFKSSLGDNRLLLLVNTNSKPKGEVFRQLQRIRSICHSFRAGDSAWTVHIYELHHSLREQLYAREDLINLMNVLFDHLQKEMNELPEEMRVIWEDGAYEELKSVIRCEETLDPMFSRIQEIMQRTYAQMIEQRETKSAHQLVQNVKEYIKEHYDNEDLSLTHLSKVFGLSAKYLGQLFREDSGVKFVEYVTEVRITRAKQLLLESDEPVQDIAALVGYTQALTFIRVFKKQTGLTPGQYRNVRLI